MFCKSVSLLTLVTLGGNRLDTGKLLLCSECNDLCFFDVIWINPIHIGFNKKKVFGIMENILMTYQYFLFQNKFTSLLIFIWTKGARTVVISH